MKGLGRACQFAALVMLPVAMLFQLGVGNGTFFGVNHLVFAVAFGVILFCIGRLLEGYAAPS